MKLWGGRLTKETNQLVHNFNESLSSDQKFYRQDIRGSIARVRMLIKQGILTGQDRDDIIRGLESILGDLDNGKLAVSSDSGYEDIRSFVEGTLTERIGETGKRLHTGCNRNDQVALDMRLCTRDRIDAIEALVKELLEELLAIMEKNIDTFILGFTYLQKAQPITPAHHMGACFETPSRDRSRLKDIRRRMNYRLLGSSALTGTTYSLDRGYTAKFLGFDGSTLNSTDSVADRDYPIELLSALSTISMHLSRFCEKIIIQNISEHRSVEIDGPYSIGSSIMSQKKNSDIVELIRGRSGRIYGALVSMLTTMKEMPLAYNKDTQEDKELTFDAIGTVKGCPALSTGMISPMNFREEIAETGAKNGFTNATDTADYLVNRGVPFRDVRGIVGQLVLACIVEGIALNDLSLEEYRTISPVLEEGVYEAINVKTCMGKCLTTGAPGQEAMKKVIGIYKRRLDVNDAR